MINGIGRHPRVCGIMFIFFTAQLTSRENIPVQMEIMSENIFLYKTSLNCLLTASRVACGLTSRWINNTVCVCVCVCVNWLIDSEAKNGTFQWKYFQRSDLYYLTKALVFINVDFSLLLLLTSLSLLLTSLSLSLLQTHIHTFYVLFHITAQNTSTTFINEMIHGLFYFIQLIM